VLAFSRDDSYAGPAANFQWGKMDGYNIVQPINTYDTRTVGSIIILTNLQGYYKIRMTDADNKWSSTVLDYYQNDWGEKDFPIVMEKIKL
jgi:hypothetical protein